MKRAGVVLGLLLVLALAICGCVDGEPYAPDLSCADTLSVHPADSLVTVTVCTPAARR